jgi:uncharacterized membrane protein
MASDFNKILYHEVESHIKRQVTDANKIKKEDWRKLMDQVMTRFAQSLVSIVASVEMAQRDAQQRHEAEAASKAAAGGQPKPEEPTQETPAEAPAEAPTLS